MSFIIAISRNNVGMNNVSCNYSWDEECFLRIVHVNVCIMNISNLVKGPQNTIDIFGVTEPTHMQIYVGRI